MIQNLIDELREQLPGRITINLNEQGGHLFCGGFDVSWGYFYNEKTVDEALTLLRQRLGLEGERR